jgi:hypothetical protein
MKRLKTDIALEYINKLHEYQYGVVEKVEDIMSRNTEHDAILFYTNMIKKKCESLEYMEVSLKGLGTITMRHSQIYREIRKTIKNIKKLLLLVESNNITDKECNSLSMHIETLKKLLRLRNISALQRKYKISNLKKMIKNEGYKIYHKEWLS